MDSSAASLLNFSPVKRNDLKHYDEQPKVSDSFLCDKQFHVPDSFKWPEQDAVLSHGELEEPLVDLKGFLLGDDQEEMHRAADTVRAACLSHGFFQVINHGVDLSLIHDAHDSIGSFFKMTLSNKLRAQKKPNSLLGHSIAHNDRFSSKLPWKETFSFGYHESSPDSVVGFFKATLGMDFEPAGKVYQKYCEEMKKLALSIMELLAISLGLDRSYYRDFFEDGCSIMRCNFYPPCQEPSLVLGTGPHCDPTSLTILHQDEVGGLEVFFNDKWYKVRPRAHALVINIGDTFAALTNGIYKSCLHRAVVNRHRERRSLAFFLCPREDKVVVPAPSLALGGARKYPDFTWSDLLRFTQEHYRPDQSTLPKFAEWFLSLQDCTLDC
ncbi:gibberellin 20 oxidase 2-like [Syzygium oleosum]|uniref:gibberellin 20 oxidase 2-like n=1 Tax=Syzygium oleosum TaxID=219896 RepID=UPI0011D29BD8|nr:gibberellin 20 oxidase 2-like [Syzygium oleosum]